MEAKFTVIFHKVYLRIAFPLTTQYANLVSVGACLTAQRRENGLLGYRTIRAQPNFDKKHEIAIVNMHILRENRRIPSTDNY